MAVSWLYVCAIAELNAIVALGHTRPDVQKCLLAMCALGFALLVLMAVYFVLAWRMTIYIYPYNPRDRILNS